jgi:hypothetical protein
MKVPSNAEVPPEHGARQIIKVTNSLTLGIPTPVTSDRTMFADTCGPLGLGNGYAKQLGGYAR